MAEQEKTTAVGEAQAAEPTATVRNTPSDEEINAYSGKAVLAQKGDVTIYDIKNDFFSKDEEWKLTDEEWKELRKELRGAFFGLFDKLNEPGNQDVGDIKNFLQPFSGHYVGIFQPIGPEYRSFPDTKEYICVFPEQISLEQAVNAAALCDKYDIDTGISNELAGKLRRYSQISDEVPHVSGDGENISIGDPDSEQYGVVFDAVKQYTDNHLTEDEKNAGIRIFDLSGGGIDKAQYGVLVSEGYISADKAKAVGLPTNVEKSSEKDPSLFDQYIDDSGMADWLKSLLKDIVDAIPSFINLVANNSQKIIAALGQELGLIGNNQLNTPNVENTFNRIPDGDPIKGFGDYLKNEESKELNAVLAEAEKNGETAKIKWSAGELKTEGSAARFLEKDSIMDMTDDSLGDTTISVVGENGIENIPAQDFFSDKFSGYLDTLSLSDVSGFLDEGRVYDSALDEWKNNPGTAFKYENSVYDHMTTWAGKEKEHVSELLNDGQKEFYDRYESEGFSFDEISRAASKLSEGTHGKTCRDVLKDALENQGVSGEAAEDVLSAAGKKGVDLDAAIDSAGFGDIRAIDSVLSEKGYEGLLAGPLEEVRLEPFRAVSKEYAENKTKEALVEEMSIGAGSKLDRLSSGLGKFRELVEEHMPEGEERDGLLARINKLDETVAGSREQLEEKAAAMLDSLAAETENPNAVSEARINGVIDVLEDEIENTDAEISVRKAEITKNLAGHLDGGKILGNYDALKVDLTEDAKSDTAAHINGIIENDAMDYSGDDVFDRLSPDTQRELIVAAKKHGMDVDGVMDAAEIGEKLWNNEKIGDDLVKNFDDPALSKNVSEYNGFIDGRDNLEEAKGRAAGFRDSGVLENSYDSLGETARSLKGADAPGINSNMSRLADALENAGFLPETDRSKADVLHDINRSIEMLERQKEGLPGEQAADTDKRIGELEKVRDALTGIPDVDDVGAYRVEMFEAAGAIGQLSAMGPVSQDDVRTRQAEALYGRSFIDVEEPEEPPAAPEISSYSSQLDSFRNLSGRDRIHGGAGEMLGLWEKGIEQDAADAEAARSAALESYGTGRISEDECYELVREADSRFAERKADFDTAMEGAKTDGIISAGESDAVYARLDGKLDGVSVGPGDLASALKNTMGMASQEGERAVMETAGKAVGGFNGAAHAANEALPGSRQVSLSFFISKGVSQETSGASAVPDTGMGSSMASLVGGSVNKAKEVVEKSTKEKDAQER